MPKLYSSRETINSLRRAGFEIISQSGSHIKMRGVVDGKPQTAIIPNHRELAMGTFKSILKQANLTKSEFEEHL
ncbi:MAG: type II toxin-antitoxin system HicA family toxin [Candidatus Amesbacteria bacterium]|nr:type II toxin-antitoxin system HicA family toxin [Candidatus Amesbacteria bacterium]